MNCFLVINLAEQGAATKSLVKITGLGAVAESWDLLNTRQCTYTTVTVGKSVAFVMKSGLEYCLSNVSVKSKAVVLNL